MAEEKVSARKKGLHGWRAAVAVFGCGSLAAFGVFGVLVLVVSTFFNATSSGIEASAETGGGPAEQIGEARSSLAAEEMNVCDDNLDPLTTISTTRMDSGEDYVDTETGGEPGIEGASRVVRDNCLWTITPSGGSTPWDFEFQYDAIIDVERGGSAEELASTVFEERRAGLSEGVADVETEGSADFGQKSYSVYGSGEQGQSVYLLVVQAKSAVYVIRFEDQVEGSVAAVPENTFRTEARKITNFLGHGFEYWIPE
ncbi:hypothetical protein [Nocardiopsis sp. NRRL B-16309]|uniref:hypothetical protein n=1 Tax=Nocardiopsis sp. NRRL B-16309 TaxID=1519494 RepID=UPI0012E1392D|nr:hypothetical protein [Nocardiopsis sp. NRRL B-16309]